jgi:hypothetical protein
VDGGGADEQRPAAQRHGAAAEVDFAGDSQGVIVAQGSRLCGEGLCIGYDSGDAVSSAYTPKFEWRGGRIHKVVFDVADDAYVDVETHLAAAMARD